MLLIESRLGLSMILLQLLALLLSHNVRAAIPLAVRSPYLSCWLQSFPSTAPLFGATWPTTFNITQILGWSVLVRVDGLTYSFLGDVLPTLNNGTVNTTSTVITPTQTVVTARAGPMQVNLTFLNPIEPQDWVKQSIPFSYLAFSATSMDGASHAVQVYSDVSGEWNSGNRSQTILWTPSSNSAVVFHSVTLQSQTQYMEVIDQAEWGTLYYATQAGNKVTFQIASDTNSRGNFTNHGVLNDQKDPTMRAVSDDFAVFAISYDLGTIKATQNPVVWAVGYTTDYALNYTDLSGAPPTPRTPYYKTQYPTDGDLIVDFLKDYSNALTRAQNLDNKILQAANSVSNNLGNLVSVSIAQVFGSMQLTIGVDTHGNLNQSDLMMFMKNIGGAKNRVNAVETLYAAFPALMFINSSFGGYLLEPLFRLQASSNYTIPYAAADLGSNYPNVAGSNSNHSQGVEQTANMVIMTYAHARASGDGRFIKGHYKLLSSWADYLNASTLFISNQTSADNLSVSNQTNLAIKGIIAIEAMSRMSAVVKQTDDQNKYSNSAARLYAQWKGLALSSDQHILAVYGQSNSWTLGYNLFADVWLGTNLVESPIYVGHSDFIHNLVLTSNFSTFGMPVDSLNTSVAASSWSLFAAAMTSNQGLNSDLITKVFNRAVNNTFPRVFPVYYDSSQGAAELGVASPAQGAMFAPLALQVPAKTINVNSATTKPPSHKKRTIAAIAGGIIGGAVAISALIGITLFVRRRWRRRRARPRSILSFSTADSVSIEADPHLMVTPFDSNLYSSEEIITQSSRNSARTEQQPLMAAGGPEGEMVALRPLSQTSIPPTVFPRSRPVAPVPAGLSSKEVARLRAEARATASGPHRHRQSYNGSSPHTSLSESTSSPDNVVIGESGEATSSLDTRRLHSEVESLRREMERLRAEGVVIEAPPSYTEGGR